VAPTTAYHDVKFHAYTARDGLAKFDVSGTLVRFLNGLSWPLISPPRANLTGTNSWSQEPILIGLFDHTETLKFLKKNIYLIFQSLTELSLQSRHSSLNIKVACEITIRGVTLSKFACPSSCFPQ
jgi:hypothetical protein